MKYKFYLPLILLFFYGCGSNGFLENEKISSLQFNKNDKNSIILFNTDYSFTENGHLFIKTHHIIKVGKNTKSLPDIFNVFDGSIEKLVSYHSRIIKPDGSQISFSKNDLHKLSLSQKGRISENFMKFTWVDDVLSPGDLIESVSEHEMTLPQLGINFSIPDENLEMYNISCSIHLPSNFNLNYKVVNDTIVPVISTLETEKTRTYLFQWNNFKKEISDSRFSKKNNIPGVLVSYPFSINSESKFNWMQFGNWYLNLIADKITPDENIKLKAFQLTQGLSTDLDKMNAIFNYCQHNVRYEQVYLDKGEFIPNRCGDILQRNYGDCKDYSTLIYSLANSVGLHPSLALCFRGRGENEFYDIPVSQFNHMIVFFSIDGKDYWFDGTNRSGTPGLPTTDLINQYALILNPDSSHLQLIKENPDNQISLEGNFTASSNDLSGELKIKLLSQYAVDFLYFDYMLGNIKMKDFINHWLKENIKRSDYCKRIILE